MTEKVRQDELQLRWLWQLIGVCLLIIVAIASLVPGPDVEINDKLMHTVTYFVLSAWFSILSRKLGSLLLVFIGLVVFGLLIEQLQGMTEYRMQELADAIANSFGTLLGLIGYFSPAKKCLAFVDQLVVRLVSGFIKPRN